MRPTQSRIHTGPGIYQTDLQSVWKVYTRKLNNISAVYLIGTEIRFRYTPSVRESWKWNSWARQGGHRRRGGVSFAFFTSMLPQPVCQLPRGVEFGVHRTLFTARYGQHVGRRSPLCFTPAIPAVSLSIALSLFRCKFDINALDGNCGAVNAKCNRSLHILWQRLWYVQNTRNNKFRREPARQHDSTTQLHLFWMQSCHREMVSPDEI